MKKAFSILVFIIGCLIILNIFSKKESKHDNVDVTAALANLGSSQRQAAIWVATSVMEDVGRLDLNAVNK